MRTRLPVLLIALAALAVAAPTASADYTLSVNATTDTVLIGAGTQSSISVEYSTFCIFIFTCPNSTSVNSPNGIPFNASACSDASGGDRTRFTCSPKRARTQITGTDNSDSVSATCFGQTSSLIFTGGDGDDMVSAATCSGGSVDMGAGNDNATASGTVAGGAGNDTIRGSAAADVLDGGDGRDTVDGQGGNDTVRGGAGRDLLIGGAGTDVVEGGADTDTASYEDRDGSHPVTVTLDNLANDGEPNENDRIANDVENLIGGAGDDTLIGDAGPNDIDGGEGGDVIDPGAGPDFVDAGPGNDRVSAVDGSQDRIQCGDGNDLAWVDAFDTVINCETVQSTRDLMPDIDADGVPAPADCDDRDPARRPGFIDTPGNGIDEDCTGADAPYARVFSGVQFAFTVLNSRTRFTRLRVTSVPEGATIEVRCTGGKKRGCFSGVKRFSVPKGADLKNVRGPVKKRKLRAKAKLEVRILAPDAIGKVVRFTMRSGRRGPAQKSLCLTPGKSKPGKCPKR